jgi:hypothetical protein
MENHPIPQDVTGFQFKLIGNTTVKQFAYVAIGVVFAGILLQLPVSGFIKVPICASIAILGIALAYLPVSGRPMDLMIGNYIKAFIRPTEFVYGKIGGQIYFPNRMKTTPIRNLKQYNNDLSPFPKDKLKTYLESLNVKPKVTVDEKENNFLSSISNLATNTTTVPSAPAPTLRAQQADPQPNPVLHNKQEKVISSMPPTITPIAPAEPTGFQTKPQPASGITPQTQTPTEQSASAKPAVRAFSSRFSPQDMVPTSPNLITGITKDARGNALPNILVEVRDKDGNPVRAFKTNETGRFTSATPLANGTYTIEFEDPRVQNRFEKIMIEVTGQIIMPIEASSVDMREELRRTLFAQNN